MIDLPPYLPEIRASAEFYFGIPAPVPVILGQITQESGFDENAISQAGAMGMLQFMPVTAKWASQAGGFGVAAPLDPKWAIKAGVWYDRHLYDRATYPTPCGKWGAALSGYNGGERWHQRRQAAAGAPTDFWNSVRLVNPGITAANQRENQEYPYRIVFKHQPKFATFGPLVCKEMM